MGQLMQSLHDPQEVAPTTLRKLDISREGNRSCEEDATGVLEGIALTRDRVEAGG